MMGNERRVLGWVLPLVIACAAESGNAPDGRHVSLMPGEYLVNVPELEDASPVHVRILSTTSAIVTPRYGEARDFAIEEPAEAELAVEPSEVGNSLTVPLPEIHGHYVLRDTRTDERSLALRAIALSATESSSMQRDALLLHQVDVEPRTCLSIPVSTWEGVAGTASPDTTPTEARLEAWSSPGSPFLPWNELRLRVAKPLAALPETVVAHVGGEAVSMIWQEDRGAFYGRFPAWPALAGRRVELSGSVAGTNGVPSPVPPYDVTPLDFGAVRATALDFTASPEELASWGGAAVAQAPPGEETECPAGCLRVATGGGIGMRFAGPLSSLRVRHKGSGPPLGNTGTPREGPLEGVVATLVDGAPLGSYSFTLTSVNGELSESDLIIAGAHDEVYVVFEVKARVDVRQSDPLCDGYSNQTAYIEAITPITP